MSTNPHPEASEQPDDMEPKPTAQQNLAWYLTLLLLTAVACMPGILCSLYYLSTVPDITWQRGSRNLTMDRIWMARVRGPIGIGYQSQRVSEVYNDSRVCVLNSVQYYLWRRPRREAVENGSSKIVYILNEGQWQSSGESCD